MYNIKKIFRKRSNILIILILSFLIFCLIFLLKYVFVIQGDIEKNIYDKHKNREIIVYEEIDKVKKDLISLKNILFIYPDYNMLELENSKLGIYPISISLINEMPKLLNGKYPLNSNEILLPDFTYMNGTKVDLTEYINKEVVFVLNNEIEVNLKVTGIYSSNKDIFSIYYNIQNIEYLLNLTNYNKTGYTRVLIDHYKNLELIFDKINYDSSLYDVSGLEEINVYESLYNLIFLIFYIITFFIVIMMFIIFIISYYDTKNERFIKYALGYNYNRITLNYIDYYLKLFIISLVISLIGYFISIFLYNKYICLDNLIVNSLFKMTSIEITIIIVLLIFVIFLIEFIGLYLLIRFILLKYLYTNEKKIIIC